MNAIWPKGLCPEDWWWTLKPSMLCVLLAEGGMEDASSDDMAGRERNGYIFAWLCTAGFCTCIPDISKHPCGSLKDGCIMLNCMWLPVANGSKSAGDCIKFGMELLGKASGEIQLGIPEGCEAIEVMGWIGAEAMLMTGLVWTHKAMY
jgi:hypothetical protein